MELRLLVVALELGAIQVGGEASGVSFPGVRFLYLVPEVGELRIQRSADKGLYGDLGTSVFKFGRSVWGARGTGRSVWGASGPGGFLPELLVE